MLDCGNPPDPLILSLGIRSISWSGIYWGSGGYYSLVYSVIRFQSSAKEKIYLKKKKKFKKRRHCLPI